MHSFCLILLQLIIQLRIINILLLHQLVNLILGHFNIILQLFSNPQFIQINLFIQLLNQSIWVFDNLSKSRLLQLVLHHTNLLLNKQHLILSLSQKLLRLLLLSKVHLSLSLVPIHQILLYFLIKQLTLFLQCLGPFIQSVFLYPQLHYHYLFFFDSSMPVRSSSRRFVILRRLPTISGFKAQCAHT